MKNAVIPFEEKYGTVTIKSEGLEKNLRRTITKANFESP